MPSAAHDSKVDPRHDMPALVATAGLAAWFWTTALTNLPTHYFERIRYPLGTFSVLIPDWRFFAPRPATYDHVLLFRVRTAAGDISDWQYALPPTGRPWWNVAINPGRRRLKGIWDAVALLLGMLPAMPRSQIMQQWPYRLVEAFARRQVHDLWTGGEPAGFQFAVVRSPGYDDAADLGYLLLSRYVPLAGDDSERGDSEPALTPAGAAPGAHRHG